MSEDFPTPVSPITTSLTKNLRFPSSLLENEEFLPDELNESSIICNIILYLKLIL